MKLITLLMILLITSSYAQESVEIEKRQMLLKNFPCMNCHANIKNSKANMPLSEPHQSTLFKHMDEITHCYSCHDEKDRNLLLLANGEKISFDESYRLCFQCHGEKKRDWELGIHGKQVGSWSGKKYKYVCTSCHEAHHPAFRLMEADPGPRHPRNEGENQEPSSAANSGARH